MKIESEKKSEEREKNVKDLPEKKTDNPELVTKQEMDNAHHALLERVFFIFQIFRGIQMNPLPYKAVLRCLPILHVKQIQFCDKRNRKSMASNTHSKIKNLPNRCEL